MFGNLFYTLPPLSVYTIQTQEMEQWNGTNVEISKQNERLCAIIRTVRTTDTTTVQHESSPQLLKIVNGSWYPHSLRHRQGKSSIPCWATCSSWMYRPLSALRGSFSFAASKFARELIFSLEHFRSRSVLLCRVDLAKPYSKHQAVRPVGVGVGGGGKDGGE